MKPLVIKLVQVAVGLFAAVTLAASGQTHELKSPDGRLALSVQYAKTGASYSLTLDDKTLLQNAKALMQFEQQSASKTSDKVSVRRNSVDRVLTPVVKQKTAQIIERYNQLCLDLSSDSICFRLFDQGLAYRFETTRTGNVTVLAEQTVFDFGSDVKVLFAKEKSFISHNERAYLDKPLSSIKVNEFASLPLLADLAHTKLVITESGLRDYPGLWLRGNADTSLHGIQPNQVLTAKLKPDSDRNEIIERRATYLARSEVELAQGGRHYPWRIVAVAKTDGELLTNQLSYLLADEVAIKDTSWIKPGKVAWDWWNANNIYGVDFEAGINTETYLYYIDFAAKYGLDYIMLDEGWYDLGDVLKVSEKIDVQHIIDYGEIKGVGVILWVIWHTLDQQLEKALDSYQQWGAAGIKVDFMQRDDQAMVNYYWKVAREAAKRQLLVNFHGSYKPAGLRRAYPNVLTREGVRGLEHNKWADYITSEHNLTLPFIRMVAGPMDYTPGATVNAQPQNFNISFNRPMSKTTRVHQMAMYVVYESPMQMLADSPSNYLAAHETTAFIAKTPTVWDDTRVLSAKLADHIIIARRAGESWYIGVMGNSKPRQFNLDLAFLGKGQYRMESFADGGNADKFAEDYLKQQLKVDGSTQLKLNLAPNGGWVARFDRLH